MSGRGRGAGQASGQEGSRARHAGVVPGAQRCLLARASTAGRRRWRAHGGQGGRCTRGGCMRRADRWGAGAKAPDGEGGRAAVATAGGGGRGWPGWAQRSGGTKPLRPRSPIRWPLLRISHTPRGADGVNCTRSQGHATPPSPRSTASPQAQRHRRTPISGRRPSSRPSRPHRLTVTVLSPHPSLGASRPSPADAATPLPLPATPPPPDRRAVASLAALTQSPFAYIACHRPPPLRATLPDRCFPPPDSSQARSRIPHGSRPPLPSRPPPLPCVQLAVFSAASLTACHRPPYGQACRVAVVPHPPLRLPSSVEHRPPLLVPGIRTGHLMDGFSKVIIKTSLLSARMRINTAFACLQTPVQRSSSTNLGWRIFSSLSSYFMDVSQEVCGHQFTQTGKWGCMSQDNMDAHLSHQRSHGDRCTLTRKTLGLNNTISNLTFETQLGMTCNISVPKDDSILKDAAAIQMILKFHGNSSELESALNQNCFSVTEDLVWEVLRRHRSDWKLALSFFNWASGQQGYSHGSRAYNEMLDILGRMKQIKLMRQIFDNIPQMKCGAIVNERTFSILLNRYAASHKVSETIEIFYKRKEHGLELDLSAFQTLLMALCRYKHVEEAESVFIQKQLEFPPVIKSRNIILNGWCVLGSLREAKRFWNDIVTSGCKPDLYTYGIFINSLTKAGKLVTAIELFTAMWEKGCNPDVTICNCIIDALCFKKKIPRALEIFEEMNERGCLPDVATYNTLIKHICKIRRMEKAYELLDEMEQKGYIPSARTYTYFFKTMKTPEEVAAMVSRMESNGCKLDGDTCNLILNLYVRWDDQTGIRSTWMEMERNGVGPDQRSYTIMIHGLHGKGKLDEAQRYYTEMRSKGLIPEPRTKLLIKAIELKRKEDANLSYS